MTIKEIINDICESAVKNNLCTVAMGGLSLYEVNFQQNNQYPLLFVTPSQNYTIKNNIITYNIYLYYIDRLLRNNDNNIDIVSYSSSKLQSLVNLIKKFDDVLSVNTDYQVYNFADTQRLTDNVGGSYMTLSVTVKNDLANCVDSDIEGIVIGKDDLQVITFIATENGEYVITPDAQYKGIKEVNLTVDVSTSADCQEEIENAYNEGYDIGRGDGYNEGYGEGNMQGYMSGKEDGIYEQKSKLTSITITDNGTYSNEDGYSEVTVDVNVPDMPNIVDEFIITDNGTYTGIDYNGDAVKDIIVELPLEAIREESYNKGISEQKALIQSITITENGTYTNENGYSPIDVNIDTDSYYNNGYQEGFSKGESEGYNEGYDVGVVNGIEQQKSKLTSITITENGVYDNENGYSEVTVEIDTQSYYDNGYDTGKGDGISEQKSKLTSITIENNGTYTNEDGYDNVIVNVSGGGGSAVPRIPNGISLANSTFEEFDFAQNDWSGVTDFSEMFRGCKNLKYIHNFPAIDEWVSLDKTFFECLLEGDMKFPKLTPINCSNMFDTNGKSDNLNSLDLSEWNMSKCYDVTNMFSGRGKLTSLNLTGWYFPNIVTLSLFNQCSKLTEIKGLGTWDTSNVTSMANLFNLCSSMTEIKGIENWDVSKVKVAKYLFNGCSSLTNLDLSNWDTSNMTNMSSMFSNCKKLTSIDLSSWDVSKVTDMSYMFNACLSVADFDLSNWDVGKVENFNSFIKGADNCKINLSGWKNLNHGYYNFMDKGMIVDELNVDNTLINSTYGLFQNLKIKKIKANDLIKNNNTTLEKCFYNCQLLSEIENINTWDTSNITNMSNMFYYCSSLTNLDLSNWDTSSVTNMSYMFSSCENLTSIDLSSWNLENVTTMSYMFEPSGGFTAVSNLSEIKMGGRINSNVSVNGMFGNFNPHPKNGKFYYPAEYADDYIKIIEKLPSNWQAISY